MEKPVLNNEEVLILEKLIEKGYRVILSKYSIKIEEDYIGSVNGEYLTKDAYHCFGGIENFDKKSFHPRNGIFSKLKNLIK